MAYGEKYHVIYCDRNKKQFKLAIHEWNYDGESVRHKAAPVPFSKTQETTAELKQGGIFPTRATVTLVSSKTFNMEELYTADERKYMVSHEPTDGSDVGRWYGNIIPNGFGEEMDNDVHYMVLTASDNLPTLKLKLFEESSGINYGSEQSIIRGQFEQSFLWVAKEALKKTGLLLPIWTMVDIQPALNSFTASVNIGINVSVNLITVMDPSRNVKNNIQDGYRFIVKSGTGVGTAVTIDSYEVIPGLSQDTIHITPIEELPGSNESGNAVIEIVPIVTDPSATYSDPLVITVHDIRVYVLDKDIEGKNYYEVNGSAMSTWDVLNNLAKQWNAKIQQNNGRWEIVRWNALKVDSGQYQYFVYNSEGVETGREDFGDDIVYACKSTRTSFRPFGHSIRMDRVLGVVGVNYIYRFKQDGDSLINLIRNGNFQPTVNFGAPPPPSNPLQFTPEQWKRENHTNTNMFVMAIQPYLQPPVPGVSYPPGIQTFISIGGIYHQFQWLTCDTGYDRSVSSGDGLRINWWQQVPLQKTIPSFYLYGYSVIRVLLRSTTGRMFYLINAGSSTEGQTQIEGFSGGNCEWFELNPSAGVHPCFVSRFPEGEPVDGFSKWGEVQLKTPPCPVSGQVTFEIVGVGAATFNWEEPGRQPTMFPAFFPDQGGVSLRQWPFVSRELRITGVFIAKIVDPSSEKISQIHPYWYTNDGLYTDRIEDIEVLTGDDNSPDHVSNIYVMDGSTKRAIKSWDTWTNEYGWGALGLILAKSVMEQYYRPWRVIDGDFVAPNIHWDSRIHFEERPGERYAILRGTIDPINNQFSGTLAQVYDESTPELPPGGNDGGGSVAPNWQANGIVRCVRDENELNTGDQEQQEVDMNPASLTYGQIRWVNIGENTEACPIGEPIDLFWGASTLPIDPATLDFFPYEKTGNDYVVRFDNDGTGKYLVFLHRASLGTVTSIRYLNGGWQAYGNLPSWQYEADTTINGYTYKVMRQIYMSGTLNQLPLIFTIE